MFNRDNIHPFFSALTCELTKEFFLFDSFFFFYLLLIFYLHQPSEQSDVFTLRKRADRERIRGKERERKKSTISRKLWRCVFTHQLGICRRLFHQSVSGRWSCSGRDCGRGRKGHEACCRRGRWRKEDRCRRTPQVRLTPDTELHLDKGQNHTRSHPRYSLHPSSRVSKSTLETPDGEPLFRKAI